MRKLDDARARFRVYTEVNGLRPTEDRWQAWLARERPPLIRASRSRELAGERAVGVLLVTVFAALSLGVVVGYGLGRALVSTAPVTLDGAAP